jgi:CspA family cold shock protein
MPFLQSAVLNGGSRHRLYKGFILRHSGGPEMNSDRLREIESRARQELKRSGLDSFDLRTHPNQPAIIHVVSPWMPVQTSAHRDQFVAAVTSAIRALRAALDRGHHLLASGMEPLCAPSAKQVLPICGDVHQIEVYDDGEIERVYNLFRQYLPELVSASANSALREGKLQKDFSLRMRNNPTSFLPRYLSQYSAERLDVLRRMMRRDYGLGDLRQMDVNPIAGDSDRLRAPNPALLEKQAAAVELRFCDSQPSMAYLRGLIILFQAIAIEGRSLARQGRRLPYMDDRVIDGNKALAIQDGLAAMFQPDPRYADAAARPDDWYHERGSPDRAASSLLTLMRVRLRDPLRDLGVECRELLPLVTGLELRSENRPCLANYAEFQQYLFYKTRDRLTSALIEQFTALLDQPSRDSLLDANREAHSDRVDAIEAQWVRHLDPQRRREQVLERLRVSLASADDESTRMDGYIVSFEQDKGFGLVRGAEDRLTYAFTSGAIDASITPLKGVRVSFLPVQPGRGKRKAAKLKAPLAPDQPKRPPTQRDELPRMEGRIINFDPAKGFGFIKAAGGGDYFFLPSALAEGIQAQKGRFVSFSVVSDRDGRRRAVRITEAQPPPPPEARTRGRVKWFNPERGFGRIVLEGGEEIFVHKSDLGALEYLKPGRCVSFVVVTGAKGKKAAEVQLEQAPPTTATSEDARPLGGPATEDSTSTEEHFND